MAIEMVEKLLHSFDKLAACIDVTRDALTSKGDVPAEVLERVTQYSDIVSKQRSLALELKDHVAHRNWEEVTRYVKLINGLSAMIRDDAQEILSGAILNQVNIKKDDILAQ